MLRVMTFDKQNLVYKHLVNILVEIMRRDDNEAKDTLTDIYNIAYLVGGDKMLKKMEGKKDMKLISREEVEDLLVNTSELSGYAFKVLDEKLSLIPDRAVLRECDKCMGASFGDCGDCEKIKENKQG